MCFLIRNKCKHPSHISLKQFPLKELFVKGIIFAQRDTSIVVFFLWWVICSKWTCLKFTENPLMKHVLCWCPLRLVLNVWRNYVGISQVCIMPTVPRLSEILQSICTCYACDIYISCLAQSILSYNIPLLVCFNDLLMCLSI